MADHLSALQLDEAAAGIPSAADQAHLRDCSGCAAQVRQLEASRSALLATAESGRRLEALRQAAARAQGSGQALGPGRARRWARLGSAVALPLAAAVLLFVVWQPDGDRLKGAVSLELLSDSGAPVQQTRVGQHVTLAVGGAGYLRAAVLAVDEGGRVSRVWPAAGTQTAPIGAGAQVRLEPGFEVTPGSVTLYAFFSDDPVELGVLVRGAEANVARGRRRGERPLDLEPPKDLAPAAARLRLEVAP
ncbi:MAG: hypothetical protein ACYC8T_02800 [Myxococcaceae bacterium]